MRILTLELLAYGPFHGASLDLSHEGGLDLVYGPNEAGKSTALRAIRGLFYGIAEQTGDAHRHAKKDLRVGARLRGDDGAELSVVRRKGRKSTLLTPDGGAMDDAEMTRLLAGVSEQAFVTMFGLDHQTLRDGAEALLTGRGSVGESLLQAGLGARGLHALLVALRAEADAIHTPRAVQKPLAEAVGAYKAALKRARDDALGVEAWDAQEKKRESAEAESAVLEREIRESQETIHRLRRAERVLPRLRILELDAAERAALGDVVSLPESATRAREEAEATLAASQAELARLSAEVAVLVAQRGALVVPEDLIGDAAMATLSDRLGSQRKAAADLPKRRAELQTLEEEEKRLRRRLGREIGDALLEGYVSVAARIRTLAPARALLEENVAADHGVIAAEETALAAVVAELSTLAEARDPASLAATVRAAQAEGDLDARLARASLEVDKLREHASARTAALGLATIPTMIPSAETLDVHERAKASIERAEEDLARRRTETTLLHEAAATDLAAILGAGGVPTEESLAEVRRLRDEALAASAPHSVLGRFIVDADAVADRMRREAERVARHAALLARQRGAARELERLEREEVALGAKRQTAESGWRALWTPLGVPPRSPPEMRAFARAHADAVHAAEKLGDARTEREALARDTGACAAELRGTLSAMGVDPGDGAGVGRLLALALATLGRLNEDAAHRRQLLRDARDHDTRAARARAERATHEAKLAEHLSAWAAATRALGESPPAPEEARAIMDDIEQLAQCSEKARTLLGRVRGIERDAADFAAWVRAVALRHAPDLAVRAADDAAEGLKLRRERALTDRAASLALDERIADRREQEAAQTRRRERAAQTLAELIAAAGAADAKDLAAIEARADRARKLDARLRAATDELLAIGEGQDVSALAAEVRGRSPDALFAERETLETGLVELEERRRAVTEDIGRTKGGLDHLRQRRTLGAEAATEAEQHLARARSLAERWTRARLSVVLLEREVLRYREQNQGPVLARGSELFRELTGGSYEALRTAFDSSDEAVLCALRDGAEVLVEGLSDGTRDQLYLALRLATLEHHATKSPPMPLVLDDVLVHFDDRRARAALEVLAALGSRLQVLLFTHHGRIVEIAREALAPARLRVHRLG